MVTCGYHDSALQLHTPRCKAMAADTSNEQVVHTLIDDTNYQIAIHYGQSVYDRTDAAASWSAGASVPVSSAENLKPVKNMQPPCLLKILKFLWNFGELVRHNLRKFLISYTRQS